MACCALTCRMSLSPTRSLFRTLPDPTAPVSEPVILMYFYTQGSFGKKEEQHKTKQQSCGFQCHECGSRIDPEEHNASVLECLK